jgi:malonyl-CoA decarboxylase
MASTAFFSDLLSSIADRGRSLLGLAEAEKDPIRRAATLIDLCEQLLSGRGEASGAALAREVLERYATLDDAARLTFFSALDRQFGPDKAKLAAAVAAFARDGSDTHAAEIHFSSEPRRQELFRRLNRAPGGTAALVQMREQFLEAARKEPALKGVDRDFSHLLSSWFNRGFLVLRRIDWSSPASVLEKIIRYEAVHEIHDWDDLRRRIDPVDRRCYAFFHPALTDEPLIFVEVALTPEIPGAVQPLLASGRKTVPLKDARTAVFYSISNCQQGLAGVSFGNFLIKQVVEELRRELPRLETFVTLSPVPGFMRWLDSDGKMLLSPEDQALLAFLDDEAWIGDEAYKNQVRPLLEALAAYYFLEARSPNGRARDPVARFHLGNGASLERINWLGDTSAKGLKESAGVMVNYLYDLGEIEKNHEAYANQGVIAASSAVKRLLRSGGRIRPPEANVGSQDKQPAAKAKAKQATA